MSGLLVRALLLTAFTVSAVLGVDVVGLKRKVDAINGGRSALLRAGPQSYVHAGPQMTSSAVALMRSFAISYRGSHFNSLYAASKVLSYQEMMTLAGCSCMGMEFDKGNWEHSPRRRSCNCLNNAAHEPCDRPVLGHEPQALNASHWSDGSLTNEISDTCGWSTYYFKRFLKGSPFSVARYNDGEWLAMELGDKKDGSGICPGNIDGLPCGSEFVQRLRKTLDNPSLLESTWPAQASQDVANFFNKDFIYQSSWDFTRHENFKGTQNWKFKQQFWLNDIIHGLVREHPADLTAWLLVLGDKNRYRVTGVGPKWLGDMKGKIPFSDFIEITPSMANEKQELETTDKIKTEIRQRLNKDSGGGSSLLQGGQAPSQVFLISASMMSNVVIADLFPEAKAKGASLIDIGSGFDPLMNDPNIRRRTGTEAQSKYSSPSDTEVQRLISLMAQAESQYAPNLPWFLQTSLKQIPADQQKTLARGFIQKMVQ